MRVLKWLFVIIVGVGIAWYFQNRHAGPEPDTVEVATPAPIPQKRLAPEGVYYLVQRVSFATDAGISGYDEGTKVKLVKNMGQTWLVTDGQSQFEITPAQATNDLDVADAVIKTNQAQAATLAESVRRQQEINQKAQQAAAAQEATEAKNEAAAPAAPAVQVVPTANPLDKGAYHQTY